MVEIWAVLTPMLLADIINPMLFAAIVYMVSTSRPVANSSALLTGHVAAYLIAGTILALGLEKFENLLANPDPIDFIFELIIGLLLIWAAYQSRSDNGTHQSVTDTKNSSLISAFTLGGVISFVSIPFAIPYFAAISQILKADLSIVKAFSLLLAYNIAIILPFTAVPALRIILGENSHFIFEKFNNAFKNASSYIIPTLLTLLGITLITDAAVYFFTGNPLIVLDQT